MTWEALVRSFVLKLPVGLEKDPKAAQVRTHIFDMCRWICDCCLAFTKRAGKFPVYRSENILVKNFLNLLGAQLKEFDDEKAKIPKDVEDIINNYILFACIWSIGAALEETSRKKFNEFLTKLITADPEIATAYNLDLDKPFEPRAIHAKLPDKMTIYEIYYERVKNAWLNWSQSQPPF